MGLKDVQTVLARLYTDDDFREGFFLDAHSSCEDADIYSIEALYLDELSREQVDFFARSLKQKRLKEVQKLLPLTSEALGDQFRRRFLGHVKATNAKSTSDHHQDAIDFCTYLCNRAGGLGWRAELACYERAHLNAVSGRRRFDVCWLRFRPRALLACLESEEARPASRALTFVAFVRLTKRMSLWHFELSLPFW